MTYVKTFAIFESENGTELNEAAVSSIKSTPEMKKMISDEIKKLTPEKKDQLKSELADLAGKLKLSGEDLKNPAVVAKALLGAGLVKESVDTEIDTELNEGRLADWWSGAKKAVAKWMTRLGVGGMVTGLATMCYGSTLMPNVDYMAYDATVTPNAWIIAGGAALAISLASTMLGLHTSGDLEGVAKAAAASKR
jgi:hypothetical protein